MHFLQNEKIVEIELKETLVLLPSVDSFDGMMFGGSHRCRSKQVMKLELHCQETKGPLV